MPFSLMKRCKAFKHLWGMQVLLQDAGWLLYHLPRSSARVQTQQLRHAALELLPTLLTGTAALLEEGGACDPTQTLWSNHQPAENTVVCASP